MILDNEMPMKLSGRYEKLPKVENTFFGAKSKNPKITKKNYL